MKTTNKEWIILRWTARITGTLILTFLLFMVLAHLFGNEEKGNGFQDRTEIIAFIFFPISSIVGLILALKWDGLGGLITVFGMIGLVIIRPDLVTAYLVLAPVVPGILYVIYWLYKQNQIQQLAATHD